MAIRLRSRSALAPFLVLVAGTTLAVAQGATGGSMLPSTGPTGSTDGGPASRASAVVVPSSPATEKLAEVARETVRKFKERLKGELSAAIKSDGLANAVSLCQTASPDIAMELSDNSGFEILRTSLKLRNPENAGGVWELSVLGDFQAKVAAGSDPDKLETFEEIVTPEGDKMFRYMSGIATGEICLGCHGSDIKPDVKAELVRYYPDDKATGYKLGDLRGAFSLVKLMTE